MAFTRTIGNAGGSGIYYNLNDRVNTVWEHHEPASANINQYLALVNRGGIGVPTRIDFKPRSIIVNMQYFETAGGMPFRDWQELMESLKNCELAPGELDGLGNLMFYRYVYVDECPGVPDLTFNPRNGSGLPPLKKYRVSMKVTALDPKRYSY